MAVAVALRKIRFSVDTEDYDSYFTRLEQMGGIVEEMIHRPALYSPSVQIRIDPRRNIILTSTHEQILDGPLGQTYQGCIFPARDEYRLLLQDYGVRVGEVLASYGVVGRLSVDYIAWEEEGRWLVNAIEINLRMGGTTHPQLALSFLTGGSLDPETGMFFSPSGLPKFYRASDNLVSERYRGLLPEDLIEILTVNRLDYSHRTETGVLFHMIGAISQFGKVGVVAIGNSRDDADAIFLQTLTVLDHETRFGHP